MRHLLRRGLEETASLWPPVREAYKWVKRVSRVLKNEEALSARQVRKRLTGLLARVQTVWLRAWHVHAASGN